jgi:hypothetical protein
VIAVRGRLDDEAVVPYAIVTPATWSPPWPGRSGAGATGRAWSIPASPSGPRTPPFARRRAAAVEAALAELPDHQREVVAHEVEGSTPPPWPRRGARPRRGRGPAGQDTGRAAPRLPAGPAQGRAVHGPLPAGAAGPVRGRPASAARPGRRRPPHAVPDLRLAEPTAGRAAALDRGATAAAAARPVVAVAAGRGAAGRRRPVAVACPGQEILARHAGQRVRGVSVPTRGV